MKVLACLVFGSFLGLAPNAYAQVSTVVSQVSIVSTSNTIPFASHDISLTPNEKYVVTTAKDEVQLIDVDSGALLAVHSGPGTPFNVNLMTKSVATSSTHAVAVGLSGQVMIYDISAGTLNLVWTEPPSVNPSDEAKEVIMTPNGKRALVVYHNAPCLVFNLESIGAPTALVSPGTVYGGDNAVSSIQVTDTHAVAVGNKIKVYDIGNAIPVDITPPAILALSNQSYFDVAITPNGAKAVVSVSSTSSLARTHVLGLDSNTSGPSASLLASFQGAGRAAQYASTSLAAYLVDMVDVSDSAAVVIGHSILASTVNVIDLSSTPMTQTSFPLSESLYDLDINEDGSRAVVHGKSLVHVYDLSTPSTPIQIGALQSPGPGLYTISAFGGGTTVVFSNSSVSVCDDRAVVAGHKWLGGSSYYAEYNVFDLGISTGTPSELASYDSSQPGIHNRFKEVSITPSGDVAAIASQGSTAFLDVNTGALLGLHQSPQGLHYSSLHGVAMTNTRGVFSGNAGSYTVAQETQYATFEICQAPYNSGDPLLNSAGSKTILGFSGTTSMSANDFVLTASGLPAVSVAQPKFGVFFYSFGLKTPTPLNEGLLYLAGPIYRFSPVAIDQDPFSFSIDLTMPPQVAGLIPPGIETHFQLWYRDNAAGGVANLSDVLTVCFQ